MAKLRFQGLGAPNGYSLYLDGTLRQNASYGSGFPVLLDANHGLAIGAISSLMQPNGPPAGEDFHGLIDDVRIYNHALSANEVQDIYENVPVNQPGVFVDRFESATLNPYWTPTSNSGGITLQSTGKVHGGSYALEMNTTQTNSQKTVQIQHEFEAPTYGRASVWVYDTGADEPSSNYLQLQLTNPALDAGDAYVNAWDYDQGPTDGGNYVFGVEGLAFEHSSVNRTKGWHEWVIDSRPSRLKIEVDGVQVYAGGTCRDRCARYRRDGQRHDPRRDVWRVG